MKIHLFILLGIYAISFSASGQSAYTNFHPLSLNADNSAYFQNPTSIPIEKLYVSLDYQGRTGLFKNVNTAWAIAGISLGDSLSKNFSILSGGIVNEKENGYINKSRFLLSYSRQQALSSVIFIRAGLGLGFYSFHVKSSNSSPGASSFIPDGSLGISLFVKKHDLGLGIAQIFNNTFVLLDAPNQLKRYFQIHYRYEAELGPYTQFSAGLYYFPMRELQKYQAEAYLKQTNIGYLGMNYTDLTGLSASGGVKVAASEQWKYLIGFSWRVLGNNTPIQANKYEVRLLVK